MKKSLVALAVLLASAAASAQTIATMATKSGGELRFQIIDCTLKNNTDKDMMSAYLRNADNTVETGCWKFFDGQVLVKFAGGDQRLYTYNSIVVTPYGEKILEAVDKNKKGSPPKLGKDML